MFIYDTLVLKTPKDVMGIWERKILREVYEEKRIQEEIT